MSPKGASRKTALITGITGQDGWYLSRFLLGKEYEVHGITSRPPAGVSGHESSGVRLHGAEPRDFNRMLQIMRETRPDEIYHLGAQTHVQRAFESPVGTGETNVLGALVVLEAARLSGRAREIRVFVPGSADVFGNVPGSCDERTRFHPLNPYATTKAYSYWQTVNHREAYGMHASNGILFNHESPRRPAEFVTRKITRGAARISLGLEKSLKLGNLDARRDWGHARDTVEAIWLMLQQGEPDDYVIATGKTHSVRDFLREAFGCVGLDWRSHVEEASEERRPTDVDSRGGDPSKARAKLGWSPRVSFEELVREMVQADLELARRELASG